MATTKTTRPRRERDLSRLTDEQLHRAGQATHDAMQRFEQQLAKLEAESDRRRAAADTVRTGSELGERTDEDLDVE